MTASGRGIEGDWRLMPKEEPSYQFYELHTATAEHCLRARGFLYLFVVQMQTVFFAIAIVRPLAVISSLS